MEEVKGNVLVFWKIIYHHNMFFLVFLGLYFFLCFAPSLKGAKKRNTLRNEMGCKNFAHC